jgi:hypothetical protein
MSEQPPIQVARGAALHFNCGGRYLSLYTPALEHTMRAALARDNTAVGGLIGERATLSFTDCALSTFRSGAEAAAVPLNKSNPLYLFGNAPGAVVRARNTTLQTPCAVRPF